VKKRVIIYEDNKALGNSLQALINATDDLVCQAVFREPRYVLDAIKDYKPDMILMDIDMPFINGIEAVKMIREKHTDLPILMQTVFDEDEKIYDSILAGANGYLLKRTSPTNYIKALHDVLDGGSPMTEYVASRVLKLLQNPPKRNEKKFNLSKREQEILGALVDGLSYKMIADKFDVTYNTVNTHINRIYKKLHVHSATEAVSKALQNGIR